MKIFVLLTIDGVLVAGPSEDEHWLAKVACRRAEQGISTQLFQLARPVTFQPVKTTASRETEPS